MMIPTRMVIDLSHHNVVEDWHAIAAADIVGVIHKCTEGASYIDGQYAMRRPAAREAGLLWGAYHFLRPGSMEEQAEHFLSEARYDGETLLAIDHEDAGVPLHDLESILDIITGQTGQRPVIYSGHVLKEQLGMVTVNHPLGAYRLWLAHYSEEPTWPAAWERPWLWQYSETGNVPGVVPPTDENSYERTDEELIAEWTWFASTTGEMKHATSF